jgi:hypothetical protein
MNIMTEIVSGRLKSFTATPMRFRENEITKIALNPKDGERKFAKALSKLPTSLGIKDNPNKQRNTKIETVRQKANKKFSLKNMQ